MELHLSDKLKSKAWLIDALFYLSAAVLAGVVFAYAIFWMKASLQNKKISEINEKLAVYGSEQQREEEKSVFDYKRKIDDFTGILNRHKLSSNIFSFIEDHTMPNVWFSEFNMSKAIDEMRLSGEAETMEQLSLQFNALERKREYISGITVLNSQIGPSGKIIFLLNLTLTPKIFTYSKAPLQVPGSSQASLQPITQ